MTTSDTERGFIATIQLRPTEEKAMNALADAWNALLDAFGPCASQTNAEAASHVHALQRMILANITARAFPDKFRTDY